MAEGADYPAQVRDYAACLNALDAPFVRPLSAEHQAITGGGDARQRGAATGLVPSKNNVHGPSGLGRERSPAPGAVRIDPGARRCKRMRTTIEHSMRLSEYGLARSGGFRFARKFVTLTYRGSDEWSPSHIRDYLKCVREWARRKRIRVPYVWVAELQGRGVIHYHVCHWVPLSVKLPFPDQRGWWQHGMSNLKPVTGGASGLMAYLGKYMSKLDSSSVLKFPKGARLFGHGGLSPDSRREIRYRVAPYWVQDFFGTFADIRRSVGGWVDSLTGLFLKSPWRVIVDGSGLTWAVRA